jgi:polyphosphate kinase 2 (PPK2 family)
MKREEIIERSHTFTAPYCVTNGKKFRLKDVDPNDTGETTSEDKPWAKELLGKGIEVLAELQDVLYAQDQWSILLIFQAMDAAGKDGAIKHVMSGVVISSVISRATAMSRHHERV